jgi:hypothetical protein
MISDLRQLQAGPIDDVDYAFPVLRVDFGSVDQNGNHNPCQSIRSGRFGYDAIIDLGHVIRSEYEGGGDGNSLCLLRAPNADDGTGYGRILQGPRDGYFAWCGIVKLTNGT